MKRIISLLVVMAMMLASVLAVIPVSATGSISSSDPVVMNDDTPDNSEDEVETFRLLPKAAYDRLKAEFEADGANTPAYVPSVTPFAPTNDDLQGIIGGNRIHSITLPIKNVNAVDANGNINFTIKVFKYEGLVGVDREPVSTHVISVTPESVGLTAPSTNVHKFVEFELDEPIDVQEDEIIALMASSDEIIPAWADGGAADIQTVINEEFLPMRWFCANIGKAASSGNNFDAVIFYDLELEPLENAAPVGTAITDAAGLEAMKIGGSYYLANDITLPDTWAGKTLKNVTFDGNDKTITLAGANGLFGDVTGSTVKNLTLAGEVTPAWGVANNASGATFKSINVDLKGLSGTSNVGAIVATAKGSVTIDKCINNAPISGSNVAGMIGKVEASCTIEVSNSKNTAAVTGTNAAAVVGQAQGCGDTAKLEITGFENSGAMTGGTTSGLAVAYNCDGGFTEIVVTNTTNLGASGKNWAGGFIGAMHRSGATVKFENCVNGKEGDANVGAVTSAGTGAAGFIMEGYTANYTLNNCTNYATINGGGGQAGAIFGKIYGTISIDTFYNSGNVTANNTAATIAGWYAGGSSLIAKNVTNVGTISANNWAAGMIGANYAAGTKLINCVNGVEGDASKGAIVGNCAKKAGFVSESTNALVIEGGANYATINSSANSAGAVAINSAELTISGFTNKGSITGTENVGGLVAKSTANITVKDSVINGSLSGGNIPGGGVVGLFNGTKFVARNVTSDYAHNVNGQWNKMGGGFVGIFETNGTAEFYFTDCVNKVSFNGNGGNPGGFIGGSVYNPAKKMAFLRCTNVGNNIGGGNRSGFLGQTKVTDAIFIDCVNTGNIESTNDNTAAGFIPWGGGCGTATFVNCVNTGNMKAPNIQNGNGKIAAGFVADACGAKVYISNSANYGNITGNSDAPNKNGGAGGFVCNGAKTVEIINSFNAGSLSASNINSFSVSGTKTITGCIDAGTHENLLDRLALLKPATYGTLVEQDKWDDLVAAFAAAKVVYDNAQSTNADKKAVIAVIEDIINDINTYVDAESGATFADPSLKINVSVADGKSTDYVALVKDGDTDATIKVLVKDITKDFDIFTVTEEEGKDIVAGTYKLYLLRGDVEVADAVADATLALDVDEVIIDVNVIKTAEQFMAMTDGNYILGNDVAVPGGIENFTGKLDGKGHTIRLTSSHGIFRTASGVTLKNFNVEAAYIDTNLFDAGVIFTATGNITIDNVHLASFDIKNNDRVGGFINSIEDSNAVISITNVTTEANIYGNWIGAGIIGRAYVKSITLENVVNNADIVSTTINHDSGNFGSGGLLSDITVTDKLTIKDAVNYANLKAVKAKMGGIVAQVGGKIDFDNVVNYGNFDSTGGWAHGEGGMIGFVRSAATITFDDCVNYGSFTKDSNTNKGGFIGMANDKTIATFTNCVNYGSISGETNNAAGGFVGQATTGANEFTFKNCTNYGNVSATGDNGAGGIIGTITGTKLELENVKNFGNITGAVFAGGIAGHVSVSGATLLNVWSGDENTNVTVTGNNKKNSWDSHGAAGIMGYAAGILDFECVYNYANVTTNGDRATNVAGFIGMFANGASPASTFTADNCANYGDIGNGNGGQSGGFIAHLKWVAGVNVTINHSTNYGDVTGEGGGHAAGFIGYSEANPGTTVYTLACCANYGDITANGFAAGLIARTQNATVNIGNCDDADCEFGGCVNNGDIHSNNDLAAGIVCWDQNGNDINISNTVNNGRVSTVNPDKPASGIAITGKVTLENVTNNGYILANGTASGLIAWAGAEDSITDCVNTGMIISSSGNAYAGTDNNATAGADTVINSGVTGDYDTTLEVWTAEDFMGMIDGMNYKLMDNIVLPEDYASIAFGSNVFAANLDGNGKIIYMKGLTCPLFSTLDNANIKDLTIVGNISGDKALAVIAAKAIGDVAIENVIVDVDINSTSGASVGGFIANSGADDIYLDIFSSKFLGSIDTKGYAGGFVGYFCTTAAVTLTNCTVGDAGLDTHIKGAGRVAGFFGKIRGSKGADSTRVIATFTDCVNYATISQVNTGAEGIAGGIIGRAQHITVILDGVENYGDVSTVRPTLTWNQGTGGLVGEINSNGYLTILSSANYGDVTTDKGQIGGLVGLVSNKSYLTVGAINEGVVDETKASYNYGDVIVPANANVFSGGIVGGVYNNSVDTDNLVDSTVLNNTNNTVKVYGAVNYGNVTGGWWANLGGIMGGQADGNGADTIEIIGATNYGRVDSTSSNVGGMLGQVYASAAIRLINCTNYGYIKTNSANGAAGIVSYTWGGTPNDYVVSGCVNYGTIENANTGNAAGIAMAPTANTAITFTNNVNYGTVFAGGKAAGIAYGVNDKATFSANVNYGLVINGDQLYNSVGANAVVTNDNVAAGAIITDTDLIKVAKTINAADYKLADLIGTENTVAGPVDPTALTYATYDANGIAADFDFFFVLTIDDESILSDATLEGDYAGHTALEARSYAAKLARLSSSTNYTLTFNAKTTGADAGFVYAITPAGIAKTYLTAIDTENMILDGDYAQFKVEYNGLVATISVFADVLDGEDWVQIDQVLLEDGAYAAIGIANGASATTGEGEDIVTFVDSKQVASVTEIEFSNTYRVGGIINAFRALDTLAINLSDAAFEAAALAAAKEEAEHAEELALEEVAAAQKAVEDATDALNAAVAEGQREEELDDEMAVLEAAIARHDQAKRVEHLNKKNLENVTANEAKAAQAYADLKASNKADVEEAVENLVATIDGAINWADYNAAVLAVTKLGDKFAAKYDDATETAVENAIAAGAAATTQAELDAQVEIINSYINALDWAAYNYWKTVMNSLKEEDYTLFTWAVFAEFKTIVADKETRLETQEQIDVMTGEIISAIEALKDDIYLAAEMQDFIDAAIAARAYWNAEEENENYTANSWADFYNDIIKPFQDAIDTLADNEDGSQFNTLESDLIAKYEAFAEAYEKTDAENSIICIVEINALRDKGLDAIEGTGDYEYSDITKLYLLAALPEAEKSYAKIAEADAIRDYDAAQEAVDAAIAIYKPVVDALADVTALNDAIEEYTAAIDEATVAGTEYTTETWNAYELALAKAEFVAVTAKSDEEVAEALAELTAAYEALVEFVAADSEALENAIALAKALNKDDYTKSSWAELRAAIVNAEFALLSGDQAVIDAAYTALVDVMDNGLVLIPETATLEALIAEVGALKATDYTDDTWLVLALALQNAKAALNSESQKDVNDAKDALEAAKAELVKKAAADNTSLKALIAEVEALKEADYTAETWAGIKTALEAAKAVLESDKQTDLDIAKATLAAAKASLDKVVVETEAEDDTKAEDNTQDTTDAKKKGCKSAIGATVVVMTAVLGLGATVVLKKKED